MNPRLQEMKEALYKVIFEAETPVGKAFDIVLLISIVLSVLAVVLESVTAIRLRHGELLLTLEWIFTILFTIEYGLRLIAVKHASRYALSFFGIVDLLAILPTYLSVIFHGSQSLLVIRSLRLLRIFRILKLARFIQETHDLKRALRQSKDRILVFLLVIFTVTLIMGTFMYLIEGEESGFTSIPESMYWAIVTMTTVGYGDIAPVTVLGQFLSTILMVLGYSVIVVPSGIFSLELHKSLMTNTNETLTCPHCMKEGLEDDSVYCRFCGEKL